MSRRGRLLEGLQPEAELQVRLVVVDRTINNVAPDLNDLEPVEVLDRLAGALHRVGDGFIRADFGRTNDFDDAIGVVSHGQLPGCVVEKVVATLPVSRSRQKGLACPVQRRTKFAISASTRPVCSTLGVIFRKPWAAPVARYPSTSTSFAVA